MTFALLMVQSCLGYEPISTIKFITNHGFSIERMPSWYLIHAVKQPSWEIHYGFSDNEHCHTSGIVDKDAFEQQLRDSIVQAVQLWLQPLREGNNDIVNTFNLKLKDSVPVTEEESLLGMGATHKIALEENNPPHFRVTFNCMEVEGEFPDGMNEYPRSFVMLGKNPQVFMFHFRKPAVICDEDSPASCKPREERDQSIGFPNDKMSGEHMFMMTTMLHELGHIFGLKDVYVELDESISSSQQKFNRSTGGSEKTVGKQPESIMAIASRIGLRNKKFVITTDDIEAVKWLYLQAHEGVALNVCPTDYEMEQETDGCIPRFPLIFAVREGDKKLVRYLLEDDSIDVDACDRYGNTAWFYAQQAALQHGQEIDNNPIVKDLKKGGVDTTAKCKAVAQPKAEQKDTDVAEADAVKNVATAQALDLKEKLGCSTLAHHDVSGNKLLLLLLILPLLLSFPLQATKPTPSSHQ